MSQDAEPLPGTSKGKHLTAYDEAGQTSDAPIFVVSSIGFSEPDYASLAPIGPQSTATPVVQRPPPKKRRMASRPGKVKKPAYFKVKQWTRVFVTRPLDPMHNKYTFSAKVARQRCPSFEKGPKECQALPIGSTPSQQKRSRFEHLGNVDKLTGKTNHSVRGKDSHMLTTQHCTPRRMGT